MLAVMHAYRQATTRAIPCEIIVMLTGDIASCYASPALPAENLDWYATREIDEMCADPWNCHHVNSNGFSDA